MKPLEQMIKQALSDETERLTGVRPVWKPSKKAHLASSAFLRGDAEGAARLLTAHKDACTMFGAPLLRSVEVENGWLLVWFSTAVLDAYADTIPKAAQTDDSYFAQRLWMYARRDDAPTPDDAAVLQGFFAVLFGLPDGERLFLAAPRQKDGMERIELELRMTRLAKILLWERRYTT